MSDRFRRDEYGRPRAGGRADEPGRAPEAHRIVASVEEACGRGIALFNEQRFFEAHEFFEYVWRADEVDERDRTFWKGLTQLAVGCCHAQRENARGALAVLDRAARNLAGFGSPHRGLDTAALIRVAREVAARIRRHGASPGLDFPRFPGAAAAPPNQNPGRAG